MIIVQFCPLFMLGTTLLLPNPATGSLALVKVALFIGMAVSSCPPKTVKMPTE